MGKKTKAEGDEGKKKHSKQDNVKTTIYLRRMRMLQNGGIACALLAMAASIAWQISKGQGSGVTILQTTDTDKLQEVFFGGNPWLIECSNDSKRYGGGLGDISPVLQEAIPEMGDCHAALLDCYKKLPSGKTAVQRFGLDTSLKYMRIVAANGEPPKAVPSENSADSTRLAKYVIKHTARHFNRLSCPTAHSGTQQLHKQCLRKKLCALVLAADLKTSEKNALNALLLMRRKVSLAIVNTTECVVSFRRQLPNADEDDPQPPMLVALKTESKADSKKQKATLAKVHKGAFTLQEMASFIQKAEEGDLSFGKITVGGTPGLRAIPKGRAAGSKKTQPKKQARTNQRQQQSDPEPKDSNDEDDEDDVSAGTENVEDIEHEDWDLDEDQDL